MSNPPWLSGLNPEQRRAAEAVSGPLCIIAGAGTGKTRTITHRIAHQVHTKAAAASEVLAVTFTDKAATELRHRLAGLGLGSPIRAATFHAAAWAQLRWFWPRLERGPLPEVLPSKVRLLLPLARRTRTEARDLAAEIEWAKARRLLPDDYTRAAATRDGPLPAEQMAEVYDSYEKAKEEAGLIDYEDMLLLATQLLEGDEHVAGEVRDRYRQFTVDEFQDVNPAQFRLLRAWLGDRDDVCVVGDDDQTIYSFTGASSAYLIDFAQHFPHAQHVTLTRNYRCTPEVLAVANRVLRTKPEPLRKQLQATCEPGPEPMFREHADDASEVKAVVSAVRSLLADDTPLGEIAVLYRINSQSEPFEVALHNAGIPYVVRGEGGFYARAEIRQALTVLAAAAQQPPPPPPLGLEETVSAHPVPVVDVVRRVLRQQMGFDDRTEPAGAAARERWRNLGVLVDLAALEARDDPQLALTALVDRLQQRASTGTDAQGDAGAVTLATLHRAKGTEFDAVFIVAAEEGLLPISYAKSDAEVEEERRLLYVGVTRARRHLEISWAQRRPGYAGKIVSRRPSRLLDGLGQGAPRSAAPRPRNGNQRTGSAASPRQCTCGRPLVAAADRRRRSCWTCFSGGADPQVADRLRQWRKQRAADDEVPAFVVFNDTTLAELARIRPTTPSSLLSITGLGRAKVSRFGDELLHVLADS